MWFLKKIIALICIIAISLSCLVVPASAVDIGGVGDFLSGVADFGEWAIDSSLYEIKLIARIFNKDVCPERPGGVNTTHSFVVNKTTKDGVMADWYVCEYCGFNSGYKADSEGFYAAYDDYVATLPSTGYTSDGAILWHPTTEDVQGYYYAPPLASDFRSVSVLPSGISELDDKTGYKITGRYTNGELSPSDFNGFGWRVVLSYPIDGLYASFSSTKAHGKFFYADGSNSTYAENWSQSEFRYRTAGSRYMIGMDRFFTSAFTDSRGVLSYNFSWFLPFFKIIPDAALNDVDYGMITRPTSIEGGNYGIVGDNGQITKVENNSSIVNETNNTYYNPATGQTQPITNWSYDYSDRSYNITTESGDTVTVTYGDEHISITETTINNSGDTITNNYTIYYVVGGGGSETPPAPHVHDWQSSSSSPAACTQPGQTAYICSCGETKTETIPALGHDWQIKQSVTTQYDDTGQLIQEGFTLYECSRCHEQYKSASGASPPSTPGFDVSGGIFSGTFGLLLDFLSFFWNTFKDFTSAGVKAFLLSLSDGASDIFGLLNPFDWSA